jgi:fatty-acyl-CoA synthase
MVRHAQLEPEQFQDAPGKRLRLLAAAPPRFEFPELDENTRATTFYTTGTTGQPKGVFFTHRQLVMHTLAFASALAGPGQGRFNRDDVYMPITPMFHVPPGACPTSPACSGRNRSIPAATTPTRSSA